MLGVTERVLEAMLTQRVVTTRGEVFTKQLGVVDADLTRDAIVKSLYEVRCENLRMRLELVICWFSRCLNRWIDLLVT